MKAPGAEELLEQFLDAADGEAEQRLAAILENVAMPVVRQVVSSVVRDSSALHDADDIVADTLLDLLRRLRDLRVAGSRPIHDLRRYIVTCAFNRCNERLRERFPARNRLRNQLRYLCGHHRELASWRGAQGEIVCGLRDWNGREPAAALRAVRLVARPDPTAENRAQVTALVPAVLRQAGGPMTLDTLLNVIGQLIGIEQQCTMLPLTGFDTAAGMPAEDAVDMRISLRQLWRDVRRLALRQRVALLLNLRDTQGRECLTLLPLTRTATIPEIAEAVGMAAEPFAELWKQLPLSDAAIAELLGATPRQVIKLRRLARERLRRMAKSRTDRNLGTDIDSSSRGIVILTER